MPSAVGMTPDMADGDQSPPPSCPTATAAFVDRPVSRECKNAVATVPYLQL